MPQIIIKSEVVPTHKLRAPPIEAWQYTGQPIDQFPDWVLSHYQHKGIDIARSVQNREGAWALRDDEGYFWRWMSPPDFEWRYEKI